METLLVKTMPVMKAKTGLDLNSYLRIHKII
jgi:hypothetical protein